MPTSSTIMDANSFRPEMMDSLDEATRTLVKRREILGPSYRLFYQEPLHLVRGRGTRLFDADGTEYLDVYNNVVSVGHCHPRVVDAIQKQVAELNTHSRYLHENILNYAEDIVSTLPEAINRIMFMCSGSEANDLAVRVAKAYSGGTGIIVSSEAYHGNTALIEKLSPALGGDQPMAIDMRMIPTPDSYRLDTDDLGTWMADQVRAAIADMQRHSIKFAGLLADSIFSSDGIYPTPAGYLKPVIDAVHEAGGIWIADEVQPGFTRTGESFWGFQRHGITPDVVTMGKPMANGMPCSGMAVRAEVLDAFAQKTPYFNTFAGNPVSMAAAQATLNVMRDEDTQGNALRVGTAFRDAVAERMNAHPCIGDVRGSGLYIGAEIVAPGTKTPDHATAIAIIEDLRKRHVLTSVCGAGGNVLKLRPPLVFSMDDLDIFLNAFDKTLTSLHL